LSDGETRGPREDVDDFVREAAERIGYRFRDPELLRDALTHSSLSAGRSACASERMEFLGDAVVSLALSAVLYELHPDWTEGQLSLGRSGCVRTQALARKARALGLDAALRLGRGEEKTEGRRKPSILAAAYESAIGAVFLDGGYSAACAAVRRHFEPELAGRVDAEIDFKTRLQERTQQQLGTVPTYRLLESSGPDHARHFVVAVEIAGNVAAAGTGSSKRRAEQDAAARALDTYDWPSAPSG